MSGRVSASVRDLGAALLVAIIGLGMPHAVEAQSRAMVLEPPEAHAHDDPARERTERDAARTSAHNPPTAPAHMRRPLVRVDADGEAPIEWEDQSPAPAGFVTAPPHPSGDASAISLPGGWLARDIGNVAVPGRVEHAAGRFIVTASGRDIWNTADEFQFVYRRLTGNGEIVARVESMQHIDPWTKAGVMMRENLSGGSRHAFMLVTPQKGLAFQHRPKPNDLSGHTVGGAGQDPHWVRLTRSGNTFSAYRSLDGSNWVRVGSHTIPMERTIYVGLAVTSRDEGTLATSSFTDIAVSGATAPAPAPPPAAPTPPAPPQPSPAPPPAPAPPASDGKSGSPSPPPAASSTTLRVMQWNIAKTRGSDGVCSPDRIVNMIVKQDVHVVSLNEVNFFSGECAWDFDMGERLHALLQRKTGVTWYRQAVNANGDGRGVGNVLLSRIRPSSSGRRLLSYDRGVAQMTIVVNGRPVNLFSTHVEYFKSSWRPIQIKEAVAWMSNFSEPRIMLGDFNTVPGTGDYRIIATPYQDAWAAAGGAGTARAYNGTGNTHGNSRFDYVFYSRVSALALTSVNVPDTRVNGVRPSDHDPVVAVFRVK